MNVFLNCQDKPIGTIKRIAERFELEIRGNIIKRDVVDDNTFTSHRMNLVSCGEDQGLTFGEYSRDVEKGGKRIGTYKNMFLEGLPIKVITLINYFI
ncbi:MAG: hypothetical protein K6G36_02365 [Candidatus Saccharibacteria bacterium]|nr:hypothetical protein [Candidatus Saccharibacteria bacterium]